MLPQRPLLSLLLLAISVTPIVADTLQSGRSIEGRLSTIATRTATEVKLDGVLDDEVWKVAKPVSGFVQSEPQESAPASEDTEVRIAFDADSLYIAAYCHDREPKKLIVSALRKDFKEDEQDTFGLALDTFKDRRNGYIFYTNPEGAKADQQFANEGREINASWDAVWWVATRKVENGWIAEIRIPFKALRFEPSDQATWGVNFARRIRRKNEVSYWSLIPRAYTFARMSLGGDLTGLDAGTPGRDLRVKPYVAGSTVRPTGGVFDQSGDIGVDFKGALTPSLTLDATINPDFAQAEADEQQVNLTQFSQFFPEKRDFFLENSGVFYVGDAARNTGVVLAPTPDEDLLPFFSRRIGLSSQGTPIPITAGGRLTGRLGGFSVGGLFAHTKEVSAEPSNLWGVLRIRRNILKNSDFGAIFMTRQATGRDDSYNRVYGLDATIRLPGNLDWSAYALKSESPGRHGGQSAVRTSLNREGNFVHVKAGFMQIDPQFNDELGYLRRTGIRKTFTDFGLRPRPQALRRFGVRELHPHIVWNYFNDLHGKFLAKRLHNGFTVFLSNGGFFEYSANPQADTLVRPFKIHRDSAPIPKGFYDWHVHQFKLNSDPSRKLSVNLDLGKGGLWNGRQTIISPQVRIRPNYRFSISAGLSRTKVDLDSLNAHFVQSLLTVRSNYSFSRNMFLDALIQYDYDQKVRNTNIRFNFIHRPLSDLYIVYNEQAFATPEAPVPGRSLVVKFTRMVSF
ncbi:MAG: carbohydrate binding family 9 domain-containing protein [Vicinamibacteria bacterium]|nr:carbohydrate binding family 9 domain-containing protein [Vicinamibacteria bacterium]